MPDEKQVRYVVDGVGYNFPSTYTDEQATKILKDQGVIKPAKPTGMLPSEPWLKAGRTALDFVKGAGKEVLQEAGNVAGMLPKFAYGGDAQKDVAEMRRLGLSTPEGTAQKAGAMATQVGEFFIPIPGLAGAKAAAVAPAAVAGAAKLLPGATRAAKAAGGPLRFGETALRTGADVGLKTLAQTGDPEKALESGVTGGVVGGAAQAAMPGISALLKKGAMSQYSKVVHPLGRKAKEVAEEHIPDTMKRGYKAATAWTREGLGAKFAAETDRLGKELEAEYARLDPIARTKLTPIYDDLGNWIKEHGFTKTGAVKDEQVVRAAYKKMKYIQDTLGPYLGEASPSTVQEVRQALDKYVYGEWAATDEPSQAAGWVRKATTDAIRRALNDQNPSLAKINNGYHLFRSMADLMQHNITNEVGKFQFARNAGIIGRFLMGAAVGGGAAHQADPSAGPFELGTAAVIMGLAMESTGWRSISAVTKNKIADMIATGQGPAAADLAARLTGVTMQLGRSPAKPAEAPKQP